MKGIGMATSIAANLQIFGPVAAMRLIFSVIVLVLKIKISYQQSKSAVRMRQQPTPLLSLTGLFERVTAIPLPLTGA